MEHKHEQILTQNFVPNSFPNERKIIILIVLSLIATIGLFVNFLIVYPVSIYAAILIANSIMHLLFYTKGIVGFHLNKWVQIFFCFGTFMMFFFLTLMIILVPEKDGFGEPIGLIYASDVALLLIFITQIIIVKDILNKLRGNIKGKINASNEYSQVV